MTAITAPLAGFVATLRHEALPEGVQSRTRFLLLDLVGNMLRGGVEAESTPPLLAAARAMGLAAGTCTVFGQASRWTPAGAALLNGALAHSLDFDDTHAASSLHPGAPVIPAVLAAAEIAGASGADVLAAIVAGYEVTNRLGLALPAGAHYARGFHPTATCGAFGAAAAAARVFGLDAAGVAQALGIALSQSAGSLQFLANGAWTKRFQVGWAAMAGLSAALLAREGFRGAADPIEGKAGFLRAYAPDPNPSRVLQDLGLEWELMATAVKPYPSCRYGHACVDAALALRAEHGLRAAEITAVTLGLPRSGMILIGEDIARRRRPANIVDGQFSGPFVVACALARGEFGWDSYRDLTAPDLTRLMGVTSCEQDPEIEAEFPANMSGKLSVAARGQVFTRKVVVPKGEPGNFLTEAELMAKYHGLADAVLGAERAANLADAVLALHQAPGVAAMLRLAVPALAARLAGE
jgi:2-methylcitrate dehydratase PrpD